MRRLAAAVQDARAELHLTVDELADRSQLPRELLWWILDAAPVTHRDLTAPAVERLAVAAHRPVEQLRWAMLADRLEV